MAKILQIGMIPHNMTLFKFTYVQYQFHRQTLPIMNIERGQIQFREYVSTGIEPLLIRTARWMFMKLGKDEVLMAPYMH